MTRRAAQLERTCPRLFIAIGMLVAGVLLTLMVSSITGNQGPGSAATFWLGALCSTLAAVVVLVRSGSERAANARADRTERDLHASEQEAEKLALVAARTDNPVVILDAHFRVEWANEAMLRLVGRRLHEVTGIRLRRLFEIEPHDRPAAREALQGLANGQGRTVELRIRADGAAWRWISADVQPSKEADGRLRNVIVVGRDVTERRETEAALLHRSQHDDLTGLANRAQLMKRLHDCIGPFIRGRQHHCAVIFFDIDRFKVINDSLGHPVGDRLLSAVAERVHMAVKQFEQGSSASRFTLARIGGDEFTVLIEGFRESSEPLRLARRIQQALALPFRVDEHDMTTTVSIGIAVANPEYVDADDLLRDADIAMYRAKSLGRSRIEVFDQAMHEELRARLELENELRRALDHDEIEVHYQPIVNMMTGALNGFEALARWRHPTRGLISPALFIPIAEETGLIIPLGRRVLNEACHQLARWQQQFPQLNELSVSANLSVKQLADPMLFSRVETILASSGIRADTLKLEITESAIMEDLSAMLEVLGMLKTLNIKLWMDDFGTGYSSLSCLHQFPIDGLKIDRSFIQSMNERRDLAAVVMSIIAIAHHLRMPIVAEGIETEEQLHQLQALECDFGQGYFFSRPHSAPDAEKFIAEYLERKNPWVGGDASAEASATPAIKPAAGPSSRRASEAA